MEDFDLEKFVDLFDTAMSSDNPTVKKAFKNLMLVAALVEAENENKTGPLRSLVTEVRNLQHRMTIIEMSKPAMGQTGPVGVPYTAPTWITSTPATSMPPSYITTTTNAGNCGNISGALGASPTYSYQSNYENLLYDLESRN